MNASLFILPCTALTVAEQIFFSCTSAFASGLMLLRWRKIDADLKEGLWNIYGYFTFFTFFSSCICAATWAVYIVVFTRHISFITSLDDSLYGMIRPKYNSTSVDASYSFYYVMLDMASSRTYWSAWQVLHSIGFTCATAANMMVLDRMRAFSVPRQKHALASRLGMAGVIAGCLVGVCGSAVSAVTKMRAASFADQAASASINFTVPRRKNNSNVRDALEFWQSAKTEDHDAQVLDSIQLVSEMSMLVIQVFLFVITGVLCARRINSVLPSFRAVATVSSAKRLHRQIVFTAAAILITFLPRATFATMEAISNVRQDFDSGSCWPPCSDVVVKKFVGGCKKPFNQYTHMNIYLMFTPEFQLVAMLLSSPLVHLVALWGMTSDRTLLAMKMVDTRTAAARLELLAS
jgi:hypothetical protein